MLHIKEILFRCIVRLLDCHTLGVFSRYAYLTIFDLGLVSCALLYVIVPFIGWLGKFKVSHLVG